MTAEFSWCSGRSQVLALPSNLPPSASVLPEVLLQATGIRDAFSLPDAAAPSLIYPKGHHLEMKVWKHADISTLLINNKWMKASGFSTTLKTFHSVSLKYVIVEWFLKRSSFSSRVFSLRIFHSWKINLPKDKKASWRPDFQHCCRESVRIQQAEGVLS